MNFEPDYRFVCVSVHCFNDPSPRASRDVARAAQSRRSAPRHHRPADRFFAEGRADKLQPDRHPAPSAPHGTDIPGSPARFTEMVKMSERYILQRVIRLFADLERGSWRDGRRDHVAALESRSKSRRISVRTFCALR